jgi:hypothetical protein
LSFFSFFLDRFTLDGDLVEVWASNQDLDKALVWSGAKPVLSEFADIHQIVEFDPPGEAPQTALAANADMLNAVKSLNEFTIVVIAEFRDVHTQHDRVIMDFSEVFFGPDPLVFPKLNWDTSPLEEGIGEMISDLNQVGSLTNAFGDLGLELMTFCPKCNVSHLQRLTDHMNKFRRGTGVAEDRFEPREFADKGDADVVHRPSMGHDESE